MNNSAFPHTQVCCDHSQRDTKPAPHKSWWSQRKLPSFLLETETHLIIRHFFFFFLLQQAKVQHVIQAAAAEEKKKKGCEL